MIAEKQKRLQWNEYLDYFRQLGGLWEENEGEGTMYVL